MNNLNAEAQKNAVETGRAPSLLCVKKIRFNPFNLRYPRSKKQINKSTKKQINKKLQL
jgi:hypothetical protein